jgi:hypothetical protein
VHDWEKQNGQVGQARISLLLDAVSWLALWGEREMVGRNSRHPLRLAGALSPPRPTSWASLCLDCCSLGLALDQDKAIARLNPFEALALLGPKEAGRQLRRSGAIVFVVFSFLVSQAGSKSPLTT